MESRVLIIGATGSTGIYLTDALSKSGYQVIATGFKQRESPYYKNNNIEYISLDISRKESFCNLPSQGVDCVVLLAGMMPARMNGYDPYRYIDINVTGTLNVLEYCRQNGIPKIIFAQSHSDVAGYWNTGKPISPDASRKLKLKGDHAVYIISKCAAVDLIEHYHQDYGINNIVFRLPTIYCYWPDLTFYVDGKKKEMAYLVFINKAMKGETIEIWGDPSITKDIVYVKDFSGMIEKAIASTTAQGIYNVGTGKATSLEEQIRGVIDVFSPTNAKSKVIYCPEKPSQTSYLYDVSKTLRELDYSIRYSYHAMLEDMKKEISNPLFANIL